MDTVRKLKKFFIAVILIIAVLAVLVIAFVLYHSNIQTISVDDNFKLLGEYSSPDDTYRLSTYCRDGGMTVDYAVLGRLKNVGTGKEKNIYWQYHCEKADVQWANDTTVVINGVELNVERDIYDYRKA